MATRTVDAINDSLTIRGVIFPPSGDSERYRLVWPVRYEGADSNSGDRIHSRKPGRGAVLTITCYPTDQAHQFLVALKAQQDLDDASPATRLPWPGTSSLAGTGETAWWGDARITQEGDLVSTNSAGVVTWTLDLVDARRAMAPLAP